MKQKTEYETHLTPFHGWRWMQLINAGWFTDHVSGTNIALMKRAVSKARPVVYLAIAAYAALC